jgi:hypothetical protein
VGLGRARACEGRWGAGIGTDESCVLDRVVEVGAAQKGSLATAMEDMAEWRVDGHLEGVLPRGGDMGYCRRVYINLASDETWASLVVEDERVVGFAGCTKNDFALAVEFMQLWLAKTDVEVEGERSRLLCSTHPIKFCVDYYLGIDFDTLQVLLRAHIIAYGERINHCDAMSGSFAVHSSILHDDPAILSTLLRAGASANSVDALGRTPLYILSSGGFSRDVDDARLKLEALMASGANINHRDYQQTTPLHLAVVFKKPDVVRAILVHTAKWPTTLQPIHRIDLNFRTPLHSILRLPFSSNMQDSDRTKFIVQQLLHYGADINATTPLGPESWLGQVFYVPEVHDAREVRMETLSISMRTDTGGVAIRARLVDFAPLIDLESSILPGFDGYGSIVKRQILVRLMKNLGQRQNAEFKKAPGGGCRFRPDECTWSGEGDPFIRMSLCVSGTKPTLNGVVVPVPTVVQYKVAFKLHLEGLVATARSFRETRNYGYTPAHLFFGNGGVGMAGIGKDVAQLIRPIYHPMLRDTVSGSTVSDLLEKGVLGKRNLRGDTRLVQAEIYKHEAMLNKLSTTLLSRVALGSLFEGIDQDILSVILGLAGYTKKGIVTTPATGAVSFPFFVPQAQPQGQ